MIIHLTERTQPNLKTRMVMNLYRIYNGFTGFDAVHALACAQTEQEAIELARPMFVKEQPSNPHYSEHLTAELVLTDVYGFDVLQLRGFASPKPKPPDVVPSLEIRTAPDKEV